MSETKNPLSQSQSWNNVAGSYAQMADWVMTPFAKQALELANLNRESNILDVACGTGVLSCMAAKSVAHVDALDFSEDMLKDFHNRIGKREIKNIELIHGDGQALPFADNTYHHSFSLFGLMFFPDRVKGFSEMYRTLKKGGTAIVSSWAPTEKSSLMKLTAELIAKALPDAPNPRAHSLTLENPETFKNEMEQAGFQSVMIHEYQAELPAITPQLFWKLMSKGGAPIALLKNKYSATEWEIINHKIIDELELQYSDKTLLLSTTAYYGVGRKNS